MTIKLRDVIKYYQGVPNQNRAIAVSPTSMSENDWLEPLDRRIKQVQKEIEDIKKETAALAALHRIYAENGDAEKNSANYRCS